jgi:hypothetical protein
MVSDLSVFLMRLRVTDEERGTGRCLQVVMDPWHKEVTKEKPQHCITVSCRFHSGDSKFYSGGMFLFRKVPKQG